MTSGGVKELRAEARQLKEILAKTLLENRSPRPSRIWNRIADDVSNEFVDLALDEPELAVRFTDMKV